jgi:hypothetical protein
MAPVLPHDIVLSGWEAVCYGFTIGAALLSWFLSLR